MAAPLAWNNRMDVIGRRRRYPRFSCLAAAAIAVVFASASPGIDGAEPSKYEGLSALVAEIHRKSTAARMKELRDTVHSGSWLPEGWGDTNWALAALYLNERVDEANARLLKRSTTYIESARGAKQPDFKPETSKESFPCGYFGMTDYVRILCLFHAGSGHYPGRLSAKTEAAMREALWVWARGRSRVDEASPDDLWTTLGTENHDLTLRPSYYLTASLLKDDPKYKDRRYEDGHTATEHEAAYTAFFREWPRQRAMHGMWIEMGSDTYQKYSWPALFNLHELAPDPAVRKGFGMLIDLALIEEAQISVRGRRGGGRSRATYGSNSFEYYKNLLYVPDGAPAASSHSKVIGTSRYQAPAAAIALRALEFPAARPFVIANRVPGELGKPDASSRGNRFSPDSALLNHAWRTPHYLIGSTLQNPALSRDDPGTGKPALVYAGISRQNRWCGILFDDPSSRQPLLPARGKRADDEMCAVYPEIEKTRGGRPQHPHWSVQHRNVLLLQRILPHKTMGSYSTGRVGIRFHGRKLKRIERDGWIFAGNGRAFVAVRFLDGGYAWDQTGDKAVPEPFDPSKSATRILIHAGDRDADGSFEAFRDRVQKNRLTVRPDRVEYDSPDDGVKIECFRYDPRDYKDFKLPRINGTPVDLRPDWTYKSPYLNGRFGEDRIRVTVGPVREQYDFGKRTVTPLP